jgi:hypothetical protein
VAEKLVVRTLDDWQYVQSKDSKALFNPGFNSRFSLPSGLGHAFPDHNWHFTEKKTSTLNRARRGHWKDGANASNFLRVVAEHYGVATPRDWRANDLIGGILLTP